MLQTRRWATAAAALVSIALPGVSAAATLNVPGDFATIQACIDAAVSGVDECVAAPGTYQETINFLGKAITVRSSGGRDVTTIDATGIGGSVVTCASGEGPDTFLDGFTITGGTAPYGGGGMQNQNSSPTVSTCRFSKNWARERGGGMYNYYSSPTVRNCTFSGNTAQSNGGGMYNAVSSPIVVDCTFTGNTAGIGGGMNNLYGSPIVINCTFSGNKGFTCGGMRNLYSNPSVTNCSFIRNTTDLIGGGMYNYDSFPKVTRCTFIGNLAHGGGGMFNSGGSPMVTDCTFTVNTATVGGGMYNRGGSPAVSNCTFSANTATLSNGAGGGMYNYNSFLTLTNAISWGNSPDEMMNSSSTSTLGFSDLQGGLPGGAVDGGGNIDLDPMFVRAPDPGPDGTWDGVDDDYGDLRLRGGSPCIDAGDPGFVAQPAETDLEGHARVLCGRVDMGAYEFGIGDHDCDQVVDLADFSSWQACMTAPRDVRELALAALTGPAVQSAIDIRQSTIGCEAFDFDADGDVDLVDFDGFQRIFGP